MVVRCGSQYLIKNEAHGASINAVRIAVKHENGKRQKCWFSTDTVSISDALLYMMLAISAEDGEAGMLFSLKKTKLRRL